MGSFCSTLPESRRKHYTQSTYLQDAETEGHEPLKEHMCSGDHSALEFVARKQLGTGEEEQLQIRKSLKLSATLDEEDDLPSLHPGPLNCRNGGSMTDGSFNTRSSIMLSIEDESDPSTEVHRKDSEDGSNSVAVGAVLPVTRPQNPPQCVKPSEAQTALPPPSLPLFFEPPEELSLCCHHRNEGRNASTTNLLCLASMSTSRNGPPICSHSGTNCPGSPQSWLTKGESAFHSTSQVLDDSLPTTPSSAKGGSPSNRRRQQAHALSSNCGFLPRSYNPATITSNASPVNHDTSNSNNDTMLTPLMSSDQCTNTTTNNKDEQATQIEEDHLIAFIAGGDSTNVDS